MANEKTPLIEIKVLTVLNQSKKQTRKIKERKSPLS